MKANVRSIRKQRKYSIEFKKRNVTDYENDKFSVPQLERLHGVENFIKKLSNDICHINIKIIIVILENLIRAFHRIQCCAFVLFISFINFIVLKLTPLPVK